MSKIKKSIFSYFLIKKKSDLAIVGPITINFYFLLNLLCKSYSTNHCNAGLFLVYWEFETWYINFWKNVVNTVGTKWNKWVFVIEFLSQTSDSLAPKRLLRSEICFVMKVIKYLTKKLNLFWWKWKTSSYKKPMIVLLHTLTIKRLQIGSWLKIWISL